MQRVPKSFVKYLYKEIVRTEIETNTHLIFSLRSDKKVSIAQMYNFETGDFKVDSPVRSAISIPRINLINILLALVYIVIRLPQDDIPERYRNFVSDLKRISPESQTLFVTELKKMGYEPVPFNGEAYEQYAQRIKGNDRRY